MLESLSFLWTQLEPAEKEKGEDDYSTESDTSSLDASFFQVILDPDNNAIGSWRLKTVVMKPLTPPRITSPLVEALSFESLKDVPGEQVPVPIVMDTDYCDALSDISDTVVDKSPRIRVHRGPSRDVSHKRRGCLWVFFRGF